MIRLLNLLNPVRPSALHGRSGARHTPYHGLARRHTRRWISGGVRLLEGLSEASPSLHPHLPQPRGSGTESDLA